MHSMTEVPMNRITSLAGVAASLLLTACGGNDSNPPVEVAVSAEKLVYTDPAATPADWQLMRDATSTNTRLVLNLVGPSDGSKYRGVGFTLQVDTSKVKIGKFTDAEGNPTG